MRRRTMNRCRKQNQLIVLIFALGRHAVVGSSPDLSPGWRSPCATVSASPLCSPWFDDFAGGEGMLPVGNGLGEPPRDLGDAPGGGSEEKRWEAMGGDAYTTQANCSMRCYAMHACGDTRTERGVRRAMINQHD
jgi:hypothetical protein